MISNKVSLFLDTMRAMKADTGCICLVCTCMLITRRMDTNRQIKITYKSMNKLVYSNNLVDTIYC
jgi:hypothetical protein